MRQRRHDLLLIETTHGDGERVRERERERVVGVVFPHIAHFIVTTHSAMTAPPSPSSFFLASLSPLPTADSPEDERTGVGSVANTDQAQLLRGDADSLALHDPPYDFFYDSPHDPLTASAHPITQPLVSESGVYNHGDSMPDSHPMNELASHPASPRGNAAPAHYHASSSSAASSSGPSLLPPIQVSSKRKKNDVMMRRKP